MPRMLKIHGVRRDSVVARGGCADRHWLGQRAAFP